MKKGQKKLPVQLYLQRFEWLKCKKARKLLKKKSEEILRDENIEDFKKFLVND